MDVTVPRRIRRRGTIWDVRSGRGDRNPEEEAWSEPGRRTGSQQPKRSDWHRVARNQGGKTHSPDHLRAPRPSWPRNLNRTRHSPGVDGCGARSALNSEPSRGRSRSLPRPRQTGAAEQPAERGAPSDAQAEFSGLGRNAACRAPSRTFPWKSSARVARHVADSGGTTSHLLCRISRDRLPGGCSRCQCGCCGSRTIRWRTGAK